jgi:hypothetical protein
MTGQTMQCLSDEQLAGVLPLIERSTNPRADEDAQRIRAELARRKALDRRTAATLSHRRGLLI